MISRAACRGLVTLALALPFAVAFAESGPGAPDSPLAALLNGRMSLHARFRYEHVADAAVPANDAAASTLRTAFGLESGAYRGLSLFVEMENVSRLGAHDYKEGPGIVDRARAGRYPVVADAPTTELNQAYLKFAGPLFQLAIGRQIVQHRDEPLNRFLGPVSWRQNWQTQDGVTASLTPWQDLKLSYGYSVRVNRVFGVDAPAPFDQFDCACHYLAAAYRYADWLKIETYGYLLDIANAKTNSTDTLGLRVYGAWPLGKGVKLLYAGEFANQWDVHRNPTPVDANYRLAEAGLAWTLANPLVSSLKVQFDYEVLEGDGRGAFQTPLATLHAFQGWADRFLTTPRDGIRDYYATFGAGVLGGDLSAIWHALEADRLGYDYGEEFDVAYTHRFMKRWTAGAKAAIYTADRNATALARAGTDPTHDATKVWAWLQFDY